MTAGIRDRYSFEGLEHELIAAEKRVEFDPEEFGLIPAASGVYPGFWCEFAVEGGRFWLKRLHLKSGGGRCPALCGVMPRLPGPDKASLDDRLGYAVYEAKLPLDYTGRLLLSRGLLHRYYSRAPWAYQETLELALEQGLLKDTRDCRETARAARDMLYAAERQDELLALAAENWWLRRCLGLEGPTGD